MIALRTERGRERLAALAGAAALAVVYGLTAAPCAWWGDGFELASAAWTLGIAHPPGFPLYTASGYLWMHLFGAMIDPGRALTWFSAACLIAAGGVSVRLLASVWREPLAGDVPTSDRPATGAAIAGLLGALWIGFSRTLWEHATFAEVYPLTVLLGTLAVAWCWKRREGPVGVATAAALGILMGLLALNHYSGGALAFLAVACTLDWTRRAPGRLWAVPLAGGGVFLVMLAGYLYLPLRAQTNPPLNWGDPSTFHNFMRMVRADDFRPLYVHAAGGSVVGDLVRWLNWWGSQWSFFPSADVALSSSLAPRTFLGLAWVVAASIGLIDLSRRRRAIGLGLLASLAMTGVIAAIVHIVDIDAFFLIGLPAMGIGIVAFLRRCTALAARAHFPPFVRVALPSSLIATALLWIVAATWPWIDKSDDIAPLEWGRATLAQVPPGGIVLTVSDNDLFPLWYQQMALGRRPDVTIVASNFLFVEWYHRYFERPERPRIAFPLATGVRIGSYFDYAWAAAASIILPNMRAGRKIVLAYRNPMLIDYFQLRRIGPLIPEVYRRSDAIRQTVALPSAYLYVLQPNPALAAMTPSELRTEFEHWRSLHAEAN